MTEGYRLRVALIQPALPAYRIPVFEALSNRSSVDLTVFYGGVQNLANVNAGTFERRPVRDWWIAGDRLQFSPIQMRLAFAGEFDVVVAPWATRSISLTPSLLAARIRGRGTVVWGHGYSKHESSIRKWVRNLAAKAADAVVFYARPAAEAFMEQTGLRESVFVAPNTIDVAPIDAAIAAWEGRDQERGALVARAFSGEGVEGRPLVLHVGRLLRENRVDLLIEALVSLQGVNLALVGDGPEKRSLEHLVAVHGLQDRVAFIGSLYDELALAPWFLSAKAFAYPANIGLSCNHALAYGLPVVTSDDLPSHNPEIDCLEPERNGLLYRAMDTNSLADTLNRLLNDECRVSSRKEIQSQFRAEFGLDRMVDGLESAILHAAGKAQECR